MSYFIRCITLITLIICLLTPACTRSGTATIRDIPKWLRSYPDVEPRIKSLIRINPGTKATFAFATDAPPERVAEFYTRKLFAAGLKPAIETSRNSQLIEMRINRSNQNSPQVNISIQAATWLTGSQPDPGKRTKVNISYSDYILVSSQSIRWDEYWPLIIMLPIGFLYLIFWCWVMIDCATKESEEGNTKLVWIGIILVAQLIGALLYFFIRRPQRKAELGR